MAVFRVERNKGYTVMSNHHLRNKELTLKAKGLLSQNFPKIGTTPLRGWLNYSLSHYIPTSDVESDRQKSFTIISTVCSKAF